MDEKAILDHLAKLPSDRASLVKLVIGFSMTSAHWYEAFMLLVRLHCEFHGKPDALKSQVAEGEAIAAEIMEKALSLPLEKYL